MSAVSNPSQPSVSAPPPLAVMPPMPALAPIPQMEIMRGGLGQYGTAPPANFTARGHLPPLLSPGEPQGGSGATKSMDTIASPSRQPSEGEPVSASGRKRSRRVTFGQEGAIQNLREAWPVNHGGPGESGHSIGGDTLTGGMHMYPQYTGMGPQQGQMQLTSAYIPAANGMLVQVPVYQPIGMSGFPQYTLPMGEGGVPGGMQMPFAPGFNFPFMPIPTGYDGSVMGRPSAKVKSRGGAGFEDAFPPKKDKRQAKGTGKPRGRPADGSRAVKQSARAAAASSYPDVPGGAPATAAGAAAPFGGLLSAGADASAANLMERVHANISASGIIFMKRKDCPRRAQKIKEAVNIGWHGLAGAEGEGGGTSDSDIPVPTSSDAMREEPAFRPGSRETSEDDDGTAAKPVKVKRPSYKSRKTAVRSKPEATSSALAEAQYQHHHQQHMWDAAADAQPEDGTFEAVALPPAVTQRPATDSGDMSSVWADL